MMKRRATKNERRRGTRARYGTVRAQLREGCFFLPK